MIKFACGHCGRLIGVDAQYAGRKGKCPKCGSPVTVPERSTVISFACDKCGHRIEVPEVHAGKKGKCPKCGNAVVVPAGERRPVEPANVVKCSMCGQIIGPAAEAQGSFVECPGCGAYIETSSGAVSAESEEALPPDVDEELAEEASDAPARSRGADRRLIVLVAAVAAVIIVAGVALIAILGSSGARPAGESKAPPGQGEVASAERPAPPVVPTASRQMLEPRPPTEAAGMTRLQFQPVPGTKRTVQLVREMTIGMAKGGLQDGMTSTESIQFDFEVLEPLEDGTAAIGLSLAVIQVKSATPGQAPAEYDSTKPHVAGDVLAEIYASFPGNRFTAKVSPRGEVLDAGLDGLFLAAAERRVQSEDDALRARLKEKADQAIQRANERFGSRENRVLALKKQLEQFPVFGRDKLAGLVKSLLFVLPDRPVRCGDTWQDSLAVEMGSHVPITGNYTLTAVEQDVCTIQAVGHRSPDEAPVVQESGQTKVSNKLGGSSEATLRIDRRTGWLLRREHRTSLRGEVTMETTVPQPQSLSDQVSLEITSTLTTLQ